MVSVQILKVLEPESVMWAVNHGTPIRSLDTEAHMMSFSGWEYPVYIITHPC